MIPDGAGKGNVVLEGNGQLQLNNTNETINGLDSTSSTASVSKSGSNSRTLQIGNGDANGSYAGGITFTGGSSAITKIGAGTQKFGNVSIPGAFATNGGTSIINGTLTGASATTASSRDNWWHRRHSYGDWCVYCEWQGGAWRYRARRADG